MFITDIHSPYLGLVSVRSFAWAQLEFLSAHAVGLGYAHAHELTFPSKWFE
jgi:hypothetical protein